MDVQIRTGQTSAPDTVSLVTHSLKSHRKEPVCVLMHTRADASGMETVEQECMAIVNHSLLEGDDEAPDRLDGTLKELNGFLKGLFLARRVEEVHMIVSILDAGGLLHVSHTGRGEAYLIRGSTTTQITEYAGRKPIPAFVHVASGALDPRDIVVLSTQRLLRSLTPAQLAQLAQREEQLLEELVRHVESDGEEAALATLLYEPHEPRPPVGRAGRAQEPLSSPAHSAVRRRASLRQPRLSPALLRDAVRSLAERISQCVPDVGEKIAQITHPRFRRRRQLLLMAAVVAILLIVWVVVHLAIFSQRGKTRVELESLVEQISSEMQTAQNRYLAGDTEAANAILLRAEERAKQVVDNEVSTFRTEALDLLDRIRAKREEMNNIVRLSPRNVVNLSSKTPAVLAQGLLGLGDGEFIVFDRQHLYRVLLNSIDDPLPVSDQELIIDGVEFDRYQLLAFLTTGNSLLEFTGGQLVSFKTEDPAGWIVGEDMKAYLRYLYVLSPENNQVYKYERLSNRYTAPVEYNVNGDLSGAIDMAIDGNVFILKKGGEVVRLFRGEVRPFTIRRLPQDALEGATKIFKLQSGNFYLLDPVHSRVIVASEISANGESSYLRQYVLEGDQVGELQDLFVDPDEGRLYVLDEKRLHVVDIE
ncbi:hypothetical protein COU77_00230 [Candidatus Peregrinibacteria bacterium CG10_big_fil_rev_8_21_14_0_10_49_16]|nr:MAG: hypothetical protein COW95_03930 [Candidatus Peregrinibacteria bacterium CG22_combo_CG10-13_8_21_14_all_49_11]PIR52457.1 MAG: hypothetical protein COU77_00230 [Candidatus Peregrinibacteria bacterium CG10_big_fil_rev_8_21_14_0_10_49_16]